MGELFLVTYSHVRGILDRVKVWKCLLRVERCSIIMHHL